MGSQDCYNGNLFYIVFDSLHRVRRASPLKHLIHSHIYFMWVWKSYNFAEMGSNINSAEAYPTIKPCKIALSSLPSGMSVTSIVCRINVLCSFCSLFACLGWHQIALAFQYTVLFTLNQVRPWNRTSGMYMFGAFVATFEYEGKYSFCLHVYGVSN